MIRKKVILLYLVILFGTSSFCYECGKEGRDHYRISGGYDTVPHQYPWMVHYIYFDSDGEDWACAGSLITDRLVLTARHCAGNAVKWGTAKAGLHDKDDPDNFVEIHFTDKVLPDQDKDNDIAIIILKEPVDLRSTKVGVVCLPKSDKKEYFGESVKTMGWGMVGFDGIGGERGRFLKQLNLQVAHKRNKLHLFTYVKQKNGVYQDPCGGDSGGPLLIKKRGSWFVIATLTGGGYDCKDGTVTDKDDGMGVWTKVGANLKWIEKVMRRYGNRRLVNRYKKYHN